MSAGSSKPIVLVTGADLAPEAQAILAGFELVYAGRTPGEDDLVRLCQAHDPVAIIEQPVVADRLGDPFREARFEWRFVTHVLRADWRSQSNPSSAFTVSGHVNCAPRA